MAVVEGLDALEVLDSRGRPTLKVGCRLASGAWAAASVPSGASTGSAEALELRDGDPARYGGLGCRRAAEAVRSTVDKRLAGRSFSQAELDGELREIGADAVGANAMLGVSIAFARAVAAADGIPLYEGFARLAGTSPRLPRPIINLFSGGEHAGGQISIQDILLLPHAAATMDELLEWTTAVYRQAAANAERDCGMRLLTADEGGLAPDFTSTSTALEAAVAAIEDAGRADGVSLAVDVAATHFFADGAYLVDGSTLDSELMVGQVASWAKDFPIRLVEDGLAEDDWTAWPQLTAVLQAHGVRSIGDDLLCTNPSRIRRAVAERSCDALLLKVNQIGTLSEAAESLRLARDAGWTVVVSARSGETEDDWLADLAVGWAADHIKVGSVTQSERLAKYNRLLEIEAVTGLPLATASG